MEENMIGKILGGRYEIIEVKGSGGMATVYKAKCRLLKRLVAVKILKEHLKDDEEVKKRFEKESRAAASLSHHNIVSIYDVGETEDGLNYIVMELVEGETLKKYIEERGYLGWHEATEFAYQIAMALECAHEHEIVHRDIKPHNILVTKDNTLKVADFGIARTTNSDTVIASGNNGVFGSVHYISPEQARGGYVDERSDIYSLGVVLYEMLTGKVPFDSENPVSVALMKIENAPRDIREIRDDIPDEVAEVVMKAISKEQYLRYKTAADMAFDLREILDGSVSKVSNYNSKKASKKKNKKEKKIIPLAILLAIILGIGTYFFFYGGRKEYQVPDLMDKTLEEAILIAEEAGFKIDEDKTTYTTSDEFEEGKIMKQSPGANTYVKRNRDIELVISSGLGLGDIEIPDVVGMDYTKAVTMLRAMKLSYRKIEEDSSEYAFNEVIRQSPKEGTKVTENYVVVLHVSTGIGESPAPSEGAKLTPVPKLVDNMYFSAEAILQSANLKLGNVSKEDSDEPEGTIISQNPKAGSESPEGSYVNIVVSTGKGAEQTSEPTEEPLKRKTFTIQLPQTESGEVSVKVVANGATIYEKTHKCSESEVDIPVASKKDATVQVYFDNVLKLEKVIEF